MGYEPFENQADIRRVIAWVLAPPENFPLLRWADSVLLPKVLGCREVDSLSVAPMKTIARQNASSGNGSAGSCKGEVGGYGVAGFCDLQV